MVKHYFDMIMSVELNIHDTYVILIFDENFMKQKYNFLPFQHMHSTHELFFVKQGECEMQIAGNTYFFKADSFIVVPAGVMHDILNKSRESQIYSFRFKFYESKKTETEPEENNALFKLLNALVSPNEALNLFDGCPEILEKLSGLLHITQCLDKPLYPEYFEHAAAQFFIDLIYRADKQLLILQKEQARRNFPHYEKKNLKRLDDFSALANEKNKQIYTEIIERYLTDLSLSHGEISLSELAGKLRLSVGYTARLIKQIYNMNFEELIGFMRVNMAKNMITETSMTLEYIAEKIGYSYNGFTRLFKKATGKTPAEFRKIGVPKKQI